MDHFAFIEHNMSLQFVSVTISCVLGLSFRLATYRHVSLSSDTRIFYMYVVLFLVQPARRFDS